MKWVINNYNDYNIDWIKDYTNDVVIYDKKDKNVGYNIYDYMDWIIKNYDNLPDVVLFGKGNMLDRHITKKEFDEVCNNTTFTPLLTKYHPTEKPINIYTDDGMFNEVNNSWYFNHHVHKHFASYQQFSDIMKLPNPPYLKFAPGGCYIVPKENILKRSKEFYEKLLSFVDYSNDCAEAHTIERALYEIWH